jgi:hypothetical protein
VVESFNWVQESPSRQLRLDAISGGCIHAPLAVDLRRTVRCKKSRERELQLFSSSGEVIEERD